jgi:aconitase A
MGWVLRLVETGADGSGRSVDVMAIDCPGDLSDIAGLGLTLAQGKRLVALVQQEIVTAQSRDHAVRRPDCRTCTIHIPSGELLPLYQSAERYRAEGVPTVILAGRHYGSGSSRDWAAKGPTLLGVRAVLARSFERINRSNLIGMGILPLELPTGYHPASLALQLGDRIDLAVDFSRLAPLAEIPVRLVRASGEVVEIRTRLLIETSLDSEMLAAGGLIPLVLDRHLRGVPEPSRISGPNPPQAVDDDERG